MSTTTRLRTGIVLLALWQAGPALWAVVSPDGFFGAFPTPDHAWVRLFPPYNEHLVRDFGLALAQFVPVAAVCVKWPEPVFVRAVLIGSLLFSVPHMVYHEMHVVRADDLVWQRLSLWFPIVLAGWLLYLTRSSRSRSGERSGLPPSGSGRR
ncbi:hypothetical protein ALI22I_07315 [Saccharothrix sp. ALI-22-I]|uniref:hypothetical protein n=1 Tax=Saccharothrix sp. ALI-22-I TaxID=1933778 RepID=UPI00097CA4C4|nr:hypothetical protein [Saccharothrix sp. ALI-22-I]ONI91681.1 hypothetical protein ALI22I_07315 [Saccharothrix sp. ALI-22-I]